MPPMTMRGFCAPRATGATLHVLGATIALTVAACSSPTQPNVSVAVARPVVPPADTQISYYSQPVVLSLTNGAATGGAAATTTVDVAMDPAFSTIVLTQPATPDPSGQLTVVLNHLSPATTYYWRARTVAGNNTGTVSPVASFNVGPLLVIQAPLPMQPLADELPHKRPTFLVANASHTGPAATLTYRFDVGTDSAFSTTVATGIVPEGAAQTSFRLTADLTSGTTYYWRAQASDTMKGVIGPFSPAQAFTTRNPDDGTYAYTFHFQPPNTEDCEYVVDNVTSKYHHPLDFPVSLVVADDALTIDQGLVLRGTRIREQLSGTIVGDLPLNFPLATLSFSALKLYIGAPRVPAHFLGNVDRRGNLGGTFSGSAMASDCCYWWMCVAPDMKWTLAPR